MRLTRGKTGKAMNALLVVLISYSSCSFSKALFTVGVQNFCDYAPYSEYKNGAYSGFNQELLDMFANSRGVEFDYKVRPIKRLYAEYSAGKFDFKYPDNPLWQGDSKRGKINYSTPVVEYIDGLLLTPDNKNLSFSELKSISLLEGFTPPKAYLQRELLGKLKIVRTGTYERLLELVLKKRVDGGYFNIAIARHYLLRTGRTPEALLFAPQLPHIHSHRLLSSIKYPQMIAAFNRFMVENKKEIERLRKKYGVQAIQTR
jgi:ABC-type amino acid transport substrate-binding protein